MTETLFCVAFSVFCVCVIWFNVAVAVGLLRTFVRLFKQP